MSGYLTRVELLKGVFVISSKSGGKAVVLKIETLTADKRKKSSINHHALDFFS